MSTPQATRPGRLLQTDEELDAILRQTRTVATVGARPQGPAYEVPLYLTQRGYVVIPVSPHLTQPLFEQAPRAQLSDLEQPVDLVQIFRRPEAVPALVDEILSLRWLPRVVWMQPGIRHDEAAGRLMAAGVDVVMDRCMRQEHKRMTGLA